MPNNKSLTPEEKINAAFESFEILKDNVENFSIREQLEMASSIRDNMSNDKSVTSACNDNSILSKKRKQLLDDIHNFQMVLILDNNKKDEEISFSTCRVIDFDKAKVALSEIIDKELASNMFSESEAPSIYDKIEECKPHIETLKRVSSNCKYGKYKVLIMGDFQSGKSTTLDAFCDGRHISAIGKGDATSAVLVSVTYAEKESIIIHWRQKIQFIPIFDKIKQYLQDFDWQSFDLDREDSRKELLDEIETLRNSKYCPNIGDGDAKFLMLCSFVLVYYGTKELQKKKQSLQHVSDISDITKFPEKGESEWGETGIEKFSIDDVIFIFIDNVECYIPSSTLKELNCTIIDSPGLFNSSYDTMVTETAMKEAHAIMYVLPYYRAMGQDICKSLYMIRDNYHDVHRKLFIVNNLPTDAAFFESNCEQINSMFVPQKTVLRYDAKLAYLAELKNLYDSGIAIENDYRHLMSVKIKSAIGKIKSIEFKEFKEAWRYHMSKYEIELKVLDISLDDTDLILEESGFPNLTSALKQFIAHNESYAVIVSNGLSPIRKELLSIENSLFRSYIEPYISSHDKLVSLWENRINIASDFQEYVREETQRKIFGTESNKESLFERMVEDEYSKHFTYDFYTRLIEQISGVLYDHKRSLLATKSLFKSDKTKFKKRFSELSLPWIQEKVFELISSKMKYLVDNMESEQDKTVENTFAPVIDNLEKELNKYWSSKFKDDKGVSMNDYLVISRHLKSTEANSDDQSSYSSNNLTGHDVSGTLMGGLIAQVSAIVAGIASMIAGYITAILWDLTGVSQFTTFAGAVLLGIGGMIVTTIAPDAIRNKFIKMLSKKLDSDVRANAPKGFKEIVKTHLKNTLEMYIANLSVNLDKLRNERDLALNSNSDQESLCFRAVDAHIRLHGQIAIYDDFIKDSLRDETI